MTKTLPTVLLLLGIIANAGCGKVDEYPFICEGFVQDAPQGDSAMIKMPTAFTPNGDGLNDMLKPLTRQLTSITFTVYNHDQRVVFETKELNKGFSASRPMDKDLYYYRIEAISTSGNRVARCGSVYALSCLPPGSRQADFVFSDQLDPTVPDEYLKFSSAEALMVCE